MKKILILFTVLFVAVVVDALAKDEKRCEDSPIIIDTDKIDDNLVALNSIRKSIEECEHATAYVYGKGGKIDEAVAFFDLMRTSGLSKKTTFIATATIWSASNIVWLAAETRIVLPGSQFIIHSATYNMENETKQIREETAENEINSSTAAVHLATGRKGANLWEKSMQDLGPGTALNAKQAIEYGWATEILEYKNVPKD